MRFIKAFFKKLLYTVLLIGVCLLVFELLFRGQFIDFYSGEFEKLNPKIDTATTKLTINVFGDHYSASESGYVSSLRQSFPQTSFINHSIRESGIIETNIIVAKRLNKYPSQAVIYQLYVGDDLVDLHPTYNWAKRSIWQNSFWFIANYCRSIRYTNNRIWQFIHQYPWEKDISELNGVPYSPAAYSERQKRLFNYEPDYLEKSINLYGLRAQVGEELLDEMSHFLKQCSKQQHVVIVVIPHCAQVSNKYLRRCRDLGAQFLHPELISRHNYPFVESIKHHCDSLQHVTIVNPLAALQETERSGLPVYFDNDPHLNEAGQEIVAQEIKNALIQLGYGEY